MPNGPLDVGDANARVRPAGIAHPHEDSLFMPHKRAGAFRLQSTLNGMASLAGGS